MGPIGARIANPRKSYSETRFNICHMWNVPNKLRCVWKRRLKAIRLGLTPPAIATPVNNLCKNSPRFPNVSY